MQKIIEINGSNLTIADVVAVARYGAKVKLDEKHMAFPPVHSY